MGVDRAHIGRSSWIYLQQLIIKRLETLRESESTYQLPYYKKRKIKILLHILFNIVTNKYTYESQF